MPTEFAVEIGGWLGVWQEVTMLIPRPLSLATEREMFSSLKIGKRRREKIM